MESDSPKQTNIGKLAPRATLSCKVSHKRLRQGAEQRALQLEERLAAQQRHTAGFDEAQSGLIQQSQLLISRNAELTHRLKTVEASVEQLQSLKLCLEDELAQVYSDRDRLAAQVHKVFLSKHAHQAMSWADMAEDEEEEEEVEEEAGVTGLAEALAPVSVGEARCAVANRKKIMKLRVRPVGAPPTAAVRVEVPQGASLGDLCAALQPHHGQHLSLAQLSLNKKTALSLDAAVGLASLGLCSGDTVWVLAAAGGETGVAAPSAPAAPPHAAVESARPGGCVPPAASSPTPPSTTTSVSRQAQQPLDEQLPETKKQRPHAGMSLPGEGEAGRGGQGGGSHSKAPAPGIEGKDEGDSCGAEGTGHRGVAAGCEVDLDVAMSQADWGPPWQRPVPATLHKLLQALPSPSLTLPTASAHSSNHHTSTPTPLESGAGGSTAEHRSGHGSGKAADGRASSGPAGALPDASAAALLAGPLAASGGLSGHDLLLVAVQAAMAEEGWCLVGAEGQAPQSPCGPLLPRSSPLLLPPCGYTRLHFSWGKAREAAGLATEGDASQAEQPGRPLPTTGPVAAAAGVLSPAAARLSPEQPAAAAAAAAAGPQGHWCGAVESGRDQGPCRPLGAGLQGGDSPEQPSSAHSTGSPPGPLPACSILAVRLTRFLVLHGCLEAAGGGGGQAGAGGDGSSRGQASRQPAACTARACLPALLPRADPGVFRALQPLWVSLRDSLAAALTAASHAAAGLPPPLGLLALPWEVKEQVLRLLQARDLAALGLVCTELRALAAEDRLWRPLFMAAFPAASSAQRQQGERQGFKWAFAVCAKVCKGLKRCGLGACQQEAAARRRASQHRGVRLPQPLPMGPGGLFMPGRPVYPPGIIGGDYDRLPSLPGGMFSGPAWGVPPSADKLAADRYMAVAPDNPDNWDEVVAVMSMLLRGVSPVSSALLTSLLFMPAQVQAPLQANNARSEGLNGKPSDDRLEATQAAASEPGPSTPLPAKRSKRTKAEPAAEPSQPTKGKGKAKGKAAKAKPAPQPGRWKDRDCNAALNMQRIGESKWRPLELCFRPDQGVLPAKGKEYPGLGYKRLRDKPPTAQQQQPAEAQ
ncbi:hypothetical protein QJQ45_000889 [Haematococcus lacustris]|nr:hypothetical protein QJQ45_000889 [Haematococcus lacustris]